MTSDTVVRVQRTNGPGLCAVDECPAAMVNGVLCSLHNGQRARARNPQNGYRPEDPNVLPAVAGKTTLYWLHLPTVARWVAAAPDFAPVGLCAGSPVDFYAETVPEQRKAQALCAECPQLAPCLGWAIARKEAWGVIGGCNAAERRALRRALRAQARAA